MVVTRLNLYEMLGHLTWEISAVAWYFLKYKVETTGKVMGRRKHSRLAQGGLEIPARLKLYQSRVEILLNEAMKAYF